jgi:hypothetical protein
LRHSLAVMRKPPTWRRCKGCGRKATHYTRRVSLEEPLCLSHAAEREARGELVMALE